MTGKIPAQLHLRDVPTLRILMLGDKGVGKTSVTSLMATTDVTPTTASRSLVTGNWSIQVRLHEYPLCAQHTPKSDFLYFVEFVDVDSNCRLTPAQRTSVFRNIDGFVLVHNLLDPRTQDNLHDWLYEPLRELCKYRHGRSRRRPVLKSRHVPKLVVGTRLDQVTHSPLGHVGGIAQQLNAEEILVNSQDPESFAPKSRNQDKLRHFLNSAVDFKVRYPLCPTACSPRNRSPSTTQEEDEESTSMALFSL